NASKRERYVTRVETSADAISKDLEGHMRRFPPATTPKGPRNIRPPVARGGPANFSGEAPFRTDWTIFSGKTEADGVHKISPPHARARSHSHSTLNTLHVCTPARPRPDWEITGGFVGPSSVGAGRIGGTGRSGRAPLRLEVSTIQSSSQGPVCKARPKAPYTMQKLVPKPDRARPRWSGISLGQDQFGPCHELLAIRCSVQCPLCLLGCVRRPVAEL